SWQLGASTYHKNDVTNVQFYGTSQYVRGLCFDAGCNEWVPQFGRYEQVRAASGIRYIKFYQPKVNVTGDDLTDMYAYTFSSGRLRLRKVYTSRWFTLATITDRALCDQSGGAWTGQATPGIGACD